MVRARALLILGVAAIGGPARAEPARLDDACFHKGRGFVQVPGTTTCVRVAGRAVAQADAGTHGIRTRTGTGGTVSMDVRSDTDLGPVRGFVRLRVGQGDPRER